MKTKSSSFFMWIEKSKYPGSAPYDPEIKYPEYPFNYMQRPYKEINDVYRMIREIFISNHFDDERVNTDKWNPLGHCISPGNTVLIKPNWVSHHNPAEVDVRKQLDCLITHPSVVRCLFDYVYIALHGKGKIIIADAPVQGCRFDELALNSGYGELFEYFYEKNSNDLIIDIADLREVQMIYENDKYIQKECCENKYKGIVIDLNDNSYFRTVKSKRRLRVTNYAAKDTIIHHSCGKNQYSVSTALLEADVIINIPKPKTHRIAGYTAALKNMIGINTRKEYLPHHRKGKKGELGDEYIGTHNFLKYLNSTGNDLRNWALKHHKYFLAKITNDFSRFIGKNLDVLEKDRKKFGMWYGNDTIWRTILDVNKIVYYVDKNGAMSSEQQRKVLHFGDMIVCGDKDGPLRPSYREVGGILFSDNPVAFDYCVVKLMGLDYKKFPVLLHAVNESGLLGERADEIVLHSNVEMYNKTADEIKDSFMFNLPMGW